MYIVLILQDFLMPTDKPAKTLIHFCEKGGFENREYDTEKENASAETCS